MHNAHLASMHTSTCENSTKHDFITFDFGFSGKFRISQVCDKNRGIRTKLSPNDKFEKGER